MKGIVFRLSGVMLKPMRYLLTIGVVFFSLFAEAATLRVEGERAWLKVDGAPLSKVLHLFEQRGVEVLIDPSLDLGRISGEWENAKVDRLIAQLASPHSYLVEWSRVDTPLGHLDKIASIRIFSDGNVSSAKPLSSNSRVLDVVEGKNGLKYIRGEIMVGFKEGSTITDLNALLRKLNGTVVEVIEPPGIYRIKLNEGLSVEAAMEIANAHEGVESSEPNRAFPSNGSQPVPITGSGAGANLNLLPGETAIAVFDSGLNPKYADSALIRGTYDALDPSAEISDPTGHGTLVALIASGAITPIGAAASESGVPVLAVRVFDENGMTSSDTLMRAIQYALNSNIDIINISFGTYEDVGFLENAINYAAEQGIDIFVASGNDGLDISANPAASPATISIGATNPDGTIADYSNSGNTVDSYEKGMVDFENHIYRGTSFASPYAAYKAAVGDKK
jgi:hypothetical protein